VPHCLQGICMMLPKADWSISSNIRYGFVIKGVFRKSIL
jgi:hypothetical protein